MYSLYVSIRVFKPSTLNYESSCHWWSSSTVWSCDLRYSSVRWTQRCWVLNPGLFASEQQSCWVCASMKTVPVGTLFETAIKTKKRKKRNLQQMKKNIFSLHFYYNNQSAKSKWSSSTAHCFTHLYIFTQMFCTLQTLTRTFWNVFFSF